MAEPFVIPCKTGIGLTRRGDLVYFQPDEIAVFRTRSSDHPTGPWAWKKTALGWSNTRGDGYLRIAAARETARSALQLKSDPGRNPPTWHQDKAIRHGAMLDRFLSSIGNVHGPDPLLDEVCRYRHGRSWQMYSAFVRVPGLLDISPTNPALAMALGNLWAFGVKVQRPLRTARSLARKRRRHIAARLGFPGTESSVRILSRIPTECLSMRALFLLRWALRDEEASRRLAHVPRINDGVISLARSPYAPAISNRALAEVGEMTEFDVNGRLAFFHLMHTVEMFGAEVTPVSRPLWRSWREVQDAHDDLGASHARRRTIILERRELPPSPLRNIRSWDCQIEHIGNTEELVKEAVDMHNCLASPHFTEEALRGESFFYRMRRPERASIQLVRSADRRMALREIRGVRNQQVAALTVKKVCEWLGRDLPRSSRRKRPVRDRATPMPRPGEVGEQLFLPGIEIWEQLLLPGFEEIMAVEDWEDNVWEDDDDIPF